MPITRHHSGRWLYQFDRVIPGAGRQRANKLLPKGWTKAKAQEYDQRETSRLWDAATGGQQPAPLISDAVLFYLKDHGPEGKRPLKNYTDIEGALCLMQAFYEGRRMDELPLIVDDYYTNATGVEVADKEPKELSRATKRNRLAYLRSACRYYWRWVMKKKGQNPGELMDLPPVNNERHYYLTRAQVLKVLKRIGIIERQKKRQLKDRDVYVARMAVRVAFYCGWRIGQVLAATPMVIEGRLFLSATNEQTKNGEPHIVPVHHRIESIARDHWPLKITKWTVSKKMKAALVAEGLGHMRLHDVRHSAASEMINKDVDLYTVGKVLGHKSQVSTARYAHLAAGRLAAAVGKIGAKIPQPTPDSKAA